MSETEDTAVRFEVYRFFVEVGRPPVPAEIAETLAIDQAAVEASLRRLADGHALVLAPGTPYIWMANPLSALPTPFSVEAADRTWFGNCIWDALGIPAALHQEAIVHSRCGHSGEPLRLQVGADRPEPSPWLFHCLVPASQWWSDLVFT